MRRTAPPPVLPDPGRSFDPKAAGEVLGTRYSLTGPAGHVPAPVKGCRQVIRASDRYDRPEKTSFFRIRTGGSRLHDLRREVREGALGQGMSPCRAERYAGPYMPRSCERIERDSTFREYPYRF